MEPARNRAQSRFMQRLCIQPARKVQVREEYISLYCLCFGDDASNIFKWKHRAIRFNIGAFHPINIESAVEEIIISVSSPCKLYIMSIIT